MKAPARSTATASAWRLAAPCALAVATIGLHAPAQAQFAGTLGIDSVNRYRGSGTDDIGPVVRASAMGDASAGAYGGISGLWRTRDAGLASADAIAGWSGRLAALPGLDGLAPDWGWDLAVHRTHYGGGERYDFSEAMAALLAPGGALRTWFAPHYFGGSTRTLYTELNASHAFDDHWRAFGHVGWLHYGPAPAYQARTADRVDTSLGIGLALSDWDFRLVRDGIVGGPAPDDVASARRRPAWILGASVAF